MAKPFLASFVGGPRIVRIEPNGPAVAAVFGGTVAAPAILSRNGVRYLRCRTWRAESKADDLKAFKAAKAELDDAFVTSLADDMLALLSEVFGREFFRSVVPVACGHSKRPNCLSVRLAVAVAEALGADFVKAFADRFMSGSSHPREFAKLPPLELVQLPAGPALVVDDVATSGFHMHEAVSALRERGVPAAGVVWLSGVRQE